MKPKDKGKKSYQIKDLLGLTTDEIDALESKRVAKGQSSLRKSYRVDLETMAEDIISELYQARTSEAGKKTIILNALAKVFKIGQKVKCIDC